MNHCYSIDSPPGPKYTSMCIYSSTHQQYQNNTSIYMPICLRSISISINSSIRFEFLFELYSVGMVHILFHIILLYRNTIEKALTSFPLYN